MEFENPAMMLVFSVTTLGTNTSVPLTCPADGSDGGISSMRRRPLLLCLAAGLAKHTATNAVQTNQVDMRTEEMRTLYICFAFALYICGHDMRRGGAFRAPDISVRLQDSTNGSGPFLYELPPDHLQTQIVVLGAAPTWETKHRILKANRHHSL